MEYKLFKIFKQGSKTYFYSSIFFPKKIRNYVFQLYAFVRKADDFVDAIPQDIDKFNKLTDQYYKSLKGSNTTDIVVSNFISLKKNINYPDDWVDAFLKSMKMDLTKNNYIHFDETLKYIYGSAEVIGLMMAKILNLVPESYKYAQMQGRSMQLINFIRDIQEDLDMNRIYLPLTSDLKKMTKENVTKNKNTFRRWMQRYIDLYKQYQTEAEQGYKYIRKRYLIPIKTASDMYNWTIKVIEKNPLIVFNKKVKPSIVRIVFTIIKNAITPYKLLIK